MSARTNYIYSEQFQLLMEMCKKHLLKKEKLSFVGAYAHHTDAHYRRGLQGNPISLDTFKRWCKSAISEKDRIKAQEGNAAAREYERLKIGEVPFCGFHGQAQLDGFHEPIKLLSADDFRPLKYSPVHIFSVEGESTAFMGLASNYYTGVESTEFVIECLKKSFFPKTDVRDTWGTENEWPVRGKVFECVMDAGPGFNNSDVDKLLSLMFVGAMICRSRTPQDKALIESINDVVKTQFTMTLEGSYDDDALKVNREKVIPMYTELEHEVLLHRFIVDEFNRKVNSSNLDGINRTEHWLKEAKRMPPVLPANPVQVLGFIGQEQQKTIMDKIGIQVTVAGKKYIYNSRELQSVGKKIRSTVSDRAKRRVSIKWALTSPGSIRVRVPGSDEPLVVPRTNIKATEERMSMSRNRYRLAQEFFDTQDLRVLARMSTEEIKAHARRRRRAIDSYVKESRRRNSSHAVSIDVAAREQEAEFHNFMSQFDAAAEPQRPTSDEFDSEQDFRPTMPTSLDWNKGINR